MKKNKKWFWLVIAISFVILISLLSFFILEYIIPFSKNTKWIENSSVAYYEALSWIEDSMWIMKNNVVWFSSWKTMSTSNVDYSYLMSWTWQYLPPVWDWTSPYDSDWNIISPWEPIQLFIWNNYVNDWTNVKAYFRVPDLNNDWINNEQMLSWTTAYINWQLTSESWALNSSWSQIFWSQINSSILSFPTRDWSDLDGNSVNFASFYSSNCTWASSACILKMSVINSLDLSNPSWITSPFIERRMDFDPYRPPMKFTNVQVSWKSNWFKKSMEIKVPQKEVIEAFDFTVFQ